MWLNYVSSWPNLQIRYVKVTDRSSLLGQGLHMVVNWVCSPRFLETTSPVQQKHLLFHGSDRRFPCSSRRHWWRSLLRPLRHHQRKSRHSLHHCHSMGRCLHCWCYLFHSVAVAAAAAFSSFEPLPELLCLPVLHTENEQIMKSVNVYNIVWAQKYSRNF